MDKSWRTCAFACNSFYALSDKRTGRALRHNCRRVQRLFSREDLEACCENPQARFDVIEHPSNNSNYVITGEQNKSTLYSSISNSTYNTLLYDILQMPISIRNRVAMTADVNPFRNIWWASGIFRQKQISSSGLQDPSGKRRAYTGKKQQCAAYCLWKYGSDDRKWIW